MSTTTIAGRKLTRSRILAAFGATSVSLDACWIIANSVRKEKSSPCRLIRTADMGRDLIPRLRLAVSTVALSIYCCLAGGLSS